MRTDDELLNRVKNAEKYGRVIPRKHARERMAERNVSAEDVSRAIRSATSAIPQEGGTVRLEGGLDSDGAKLVVVVAEDPQGLRLITIM
jgi:hypothetical protein